MFFVYMLMFMIIFIGIALIGAGLQALISRPHGEEELRHQCEDMHCSTEKRNPEQDAEFYKSQEEVTPDELVCKNWIRDNFRPALRRAERWAKDHNRISATVEVFPPTLSKGDTKKLEAMMDQAMEAYGYQLLSNYLTTNGDNLRFTFSWR